MRNDRQTHEGIERRVQVEDEAGRDDHEQVVLR